MIVSIGEVFEDVLSRSSVQSQGPTSNKDEWKKMSAVMRDFNKGHLNSQAMQVHRKFRFIGQNLMLMQTTLMKPKMGGM